MKYVPRNIAQFASTRETSNEIALAIFEIAEEGSEARVWADPTPDEDARVLSRAWALADADKTELYWGENTITRQACGSKTVTISKDGRALWTGKAKDHTDAIKKYREELGSEALDYDAVNPKWIYDLDFDFESHQA
jgi:YccJ-like protein